MIFEDRIAASRGLFKTLSSKNSGLYTIGVDALWKLCSTQPKIKKSEFREKLKEDLDTLGIARDFNVKDDDVLEWTGPVTYEGLPNFIYAQLKHAGWFVEVPSRTSGAEIVLVVSREAREVASFVYRFRHRTDSASRSYVYPAYTEAAEADARWRKVRDGADLTDEDLTDEELDGVAKQLVESFLTIRENGEALLSRLYGVSQDLQSYDLQFRSLHTGREILQKTIQDYIPEVEDVLRPLQWEDGYDVYGFALVQILREWEQDERLASFLLEHADSLKDKSLGLYELSLIRSAFAVQSYVYSEKVAEAKRDAEDVKGEVVETINTRFRALTNISDDISSRLDAIIEQVSAVDSRTEALRALRRTFDAFPREVLTVKSLRLPKRAGEKQGATHHLAAPNDNGTIGTISDVLGRDVIKTSIGRTRSVLEQRGGVLVTETYEPQDRGELVDLLVAVMVSGRVDAGFTLRSLDDSQGVHANGFRMPAMKVISVDKEDE